MWSTETSLFLSPRELAIACIISNAFVASNVDVVSLVYGRFMFPQSNLCYFISMDFSVCLTFFFCMALFYLKHIECY